MMGMLEAERGKQKEQQLENWKDLGVARVENPGVESWSHEVLGKTTQGSEQVNSTEWVPKAALKSLSTENVSKEPCRAWLLSKFVLLSNDPERALPQSPQNPLPSTQGLRHGRLPPPTLAKELAHKLLGPR